MMMVWVLKDIDQDDYLVIDEGPRQVLLCWSSRDMATTVRFALGQTEFADIVPVLTEDMERRFSRGDLDRPIADLLDIFKL